MPTALRTRCRPWFTSSWACTITSWTSRRQKAQTWPDCKPRPRRELGRCRRMQGRSWRGSSCRHCRCSPFQSYFTGVAKGLQGAARVPHLGRVLFDEPLFELRRPGAEHSKPGWVLNKAAFQAAIGRPPDCQAACEVEKYQKETKNTARIESIEDRRRPKCQSCPGQTSLGGRGSSGDAALCG